MTDKIPNTTDAEKWIDEDTFIYKGKRYTITPEWKVVRAKIIEGKDKKVLTNAYAK